MVEINRYSICTCASRYYNLASELLPNLVGDEDWHCIGISNFVKRAETVLREARQRNCLVTEEEEKDYIINNFKDMEIGMVEYLAEMYQGYTQTKLDIREQHMDFTVLAQSIAYQCFLIDRQTFPESVGFDTEYNFKDYVHVVRNVLAEMDKKASATDKEYINTLCSKLDKSLKFMLESVKVYDDWLAQGRGR